MNNAIELLALDISPDEDIAALSAWLWQQRIPHRVYEQRGRQHLAVFQAAHVELVRKVYGELVGGRLRIEQVKAVGQQPAGESLMATVIGFVRSAPFCSAIIGICLIVALLSLVDPRGHLVSLLTFTPIEFDDHELVVLSLSETLARGQYWRLLTPVFLHFGLLHLVFNMLWLWEIGRRIERRHGSGRVVALLVLCGIGGNLGQYLASSSALFGGMSGVIYGLLGYVWLWGRLRPAENFQLPPGIMMVMMVWLVICAVGIIEALGLGAIANAAHLSGLVLGLFSALVLAPQSSQQS